MVHPSAYRIVPRKQMVVPMPEKPNSGIPVIPSALQIDSYFALLISNTYG